MYLLKIYLRIIKKIARSKNGFFYKHHRYLLKRYYSGDSFKAFNEVLWERGFLQCRGDVTDPDNEDRDYRQGVTFHDIYQKGIKPFINANSYVLEIGCGRGFWTKALLTAKEVWCLEAKSIKNNDIMSYLSNPKNLKYIEVHDYECKELPDDYFDFIFSSGTFVHLPWEGICAYMENMYSKAKKGAKGVIHISDDKKDPGNINYGEWYPGCFIPNNSQKMGNLLRDIGWKVFDEDFLHCERDSLIFFGR